MMQDFHIKPILNDDDWLIAKRIREEVFIVEQECPPELEWDEFDASSVHYLASVHGDIIGTARIRESEFDGEIVTKLERFAVLRDFRGRGLGKMLVKAVLDAALEEGYKKAFIHAQSHLEKMYQNLGFVRVGDEFEEAGIPHVAMMFDTELKGANEEQS